jgi:hypothetical protein
MTITKIKSIKGEPKEYGKEIVSYDITNQVFQSLSKKSYACTK